MPPHPEADFVSWFTSQGGTVSSSVQVFNYGQGQGRGARATADIPAEATLFSIPRNLVLSTTTASLPSKLSPQEWASVNEHGWCGLILCLLYEAALGSQSRWAPYFALLPTEFNSLMWWSEAELEELKGSMVLDKIGRQAAEQDYHQYVVPLLRKRSDVFQTVGDESKFSVHAYHVMGSLILSRSFNVDPAGHDAEDDDEEQQQHTDVSMASGSSNIGDVTGHSDQLADEDPNGEDSDGEEEASAGHVAMVPFADILNAKSGANNAELSYESVRCQPSLQDDHNIYYVAQEHLVMKSVKPIKKSEQI